jgi:hypothetical protein
MKVSKNEVFIEAKFDKADKKRAKIKELQKKMLGGDEPIINPLNYQLTLIQAMNFYNIYSSDDDKKNWTLESITDKSRRSSLSKINDFYFKQIGVLIHLQERDQYLDIHELEYIESKFIELEDMIEPVVKVVKNVINLQDRIKKIALDFASEIDGEIDTYIKSGYPKDFAFQNSVKTISGQAAKLIPDFYSSQITELEGVLRNDCEQLNESYSHLKTIQIKRYLQLLKDLVSSCSQQVVSDKKPRTIKQKTPTVLVKSLKYLKEYSELSLKSENPTKLINCKEVWIYDTIKRKLTVYRAEEALSVKGTTIVGYDIESSSVKSIRDPKLISTLVLNKKTLKQEYATIKSKEYTPNGRINDNMIILKIF